MSDGSSIEWLAWPGYRPATWNPTRGCSRVSEGCRNCYAEVMAARFSQPGQWGHGIAEMRGGDHRWTGRVELDDAKLLLPLRWRAPRVIFVNSTSDLFHEKLPDEAIDRVFAVMALCPQHRFIVLTKRAERMRDRLMADAWLRVARAAVAMMPPSLRFSNVIGTDDWWPLPNVILGVSVEDQATADERVPHLLATQAACRMISFEPLLEDLGEIDLTGIRWCVVGGESGPGARPMHPDWARSIRDQCQAAEVPFFFKQWGEWVGGDVYRIGDRGGFACHQNGDPNKRNDGTNYIDHWWSGDAFGGVISTRVGKHRAGRLLDGRTHDEFPEVEIANR